MKQQYVLKRKNPWKKFLSKITPVCASYFDKKANKIWLEVEHEKAL